MSELDLKMQAALIVSAVEPDSPAARAGVRVGDLLQKINGKPIMDVLDYRFHAAAERLGLSLERDGAPVRVTVRMDVGEDAGLSFLSDLGDRIHTCKNKCVFCFIHQQPRKMRKSLYLMDDDFRLSFMHGNYVTLTNITPEEWERMLEQRLSPLYVSVHATDPELRGRLLGRREATPILPHLRRLAAGRIDVHGQIVLCPGWNDGDALERTLTELAAEHPARTGLRAGVLSVAVVPVGLTRFRERLPRLDAVEQEYARNMIAAMARWGKEFRRTLGTRFVWLADEWYFLAGVPVPGKPHYEEFPQLEDGVGTLRLFLEDARKLDRLLPARARTPISATLVTAEMPAPVIREFAGRLNRIEGVDITVCVIKNDFFGGDIHIAGLLTATDILRGLTGFSERRDVIYLPKICLRDETLFLDDRTLAEARADSGLDLRVTGNLPRDLAECLGLIRSNAGLRRGAGSRVMEESARSLQTSPAGQGEM